MLVERADGRHWVVKQARPKLKVATEWLCDPARMHREALATRWLTDLLPAGLVSPLVFEDRPHNLLALEYVPLPHRNWKEMLLSQPCEEAHVVQFGRLLGLLHRHAYEQQAEMPADLADRSFFAALRLDPYYGYTSQQIPAAAAFLQRLIDRTRACRDTLVHGDFSPKNILVHNNRLVLLDHEVAHWGDASFDLGFSLAHLLSKAHFLPPWRAGT